MSLYAYGPFAMLQIPSRLIRQRLFLSSTKREISHFYVVVVQRRLRNVQKIGPQCVRVATAFLFALVREYGAV